MKINVLIVSNGQTCHTCLSEINNLIFNKQPFYFHYGPFHIIDDMKTQLQHSGAYKMLDCIIACENYTAPNVMPYTITRQFSDPNADIELRQKILNLLCLPHTDKLLPYGRPNTSVDLWLFAYVDRNLVGLVYAVYTKGFVVISILTTNGVSNFHSNKIAYDLISEVERRWTPYETYVSADHYKMKYMLNTLPSKLVRYIEDDIFLL